MGQTRRLRWSYSLICGTGGNGNNDWFCELENLRWGTIRRESDSACHYITCQYKNSIDGLWKSHNRWLDAEYVLDYVYLFGFAISPLCRSSERLSCQNPRKNVVKTATRYFPNIWKDNHQNMTSLVSSVSKKPLKSSWNMSKNRLSSMSIPSHVIGQNSKTTQSRVTPSARLTRGAAYIRPGKCRLKSQYEQL